LLLFAAVDDSIFALFRDWSVFALGISVATETTTQHGFFLSPLPLIYDKVLKIARVSLL
jgi:hypothetical protein